MLTIVLDYIYYNDIWVVAFFLLSMYMITAQTANKIARFVNQIEGSDHRVPSYLQSEIGWNTGVGKNCAVCDGMSVIMFKSHGNHIKKACFFALIVAK